MKITNQQELDKLIATADWSDTIALQENLEITFDCVIPCSIRVWNLKAWDIKARNIDAHNIDALDIKAFDIKANDINANDIDASNIQAYDIDANDIDAYNIDAGNINACNINACNIDACNITYYTFCIAQESFTCESAKGSRENSLHTCLDQEIKYIDAATLPEQKPAIEKSSEVDKVQEAKRELRYLLEINPCYDYYYDHGRTLEEIRKSAQNLINALDSQSNVNDIDNPVNIEEEETDSDIDVIKTKSIWKPMSELNYDVLNIYVEWDDDLDILPAQYSHARGTIFVQIGEKYSQLKNDCHRFKRWCTLTDFNKQVQDNTDRLDRLENLNK